MVVAGGWRVEDGKMWLKGGNLQLQGEQVWGPDTAEVMGDG
jgi:hypothetical protein